MSLPAGVTCLHDKVVVKNILRVIIKCYLCVVLHIRAWGSKLRNRQVKLSDAGSYMCVANNSVGTQRIQAFLVVNGMLTFSMLSPAFFETKEIILSIKIILRSINSACTKFSLRWRRDLRKILCEILNKVLATCT